MAINTNSFQIILAPSLEEARKIAASTTVVATVEAEYGDYCIEGTYITLAHHGSRSSNPAPCNTPNITPLEGGLILVSHLDLDALGGIMRIMGTQIDNNAFWAGAELIDVNGIHHIHELDTIVQNQLNAFYAWKDAQPRKRITETTDITSEVIEHQKIIEIILNQNHPDHDSMIRAGILWEKEASANVESKLVFENSMVRAFITDGVFCSAGYYSPATQSIVPATVVWNTVTNGISLAFADGGSSLDAKQIVTELWGPEAGGRRGIAGSPRNWDLTENEARLEFYRCIDTLLDYMQK